MKKILLFALPLLLFSVLGSQAVFAEDDLLCTGRIKGETVVDPTKANFNGGVTTFYDAGDLKLVDLSVMGLGMGYAPSREAAACSIAPEDETYMSLSPDEFGIKGFAWNTNVGFISMYCDGASAPYENLGYVCGDYKYGVKLGETGTFGAAAGQRPLIGYAYNDVLGYINFTCNGDNNGLGDTCGGIDYGVKRDALGNLSGYAYTSAGIYLVFDGVNVGIPGAKAEEIGWCADKPFVCVEVQPDPKTLDYSLDGSYKLANGDDGYQIHIYLKDENGNYDPTKYDENAFFESLAFEWTDRVKLNQLGGKQVRNSLAEVSNPYEQRLGGVVYKPVSGLSLSDFTNDGNGHFILNNPISSYAPTTDGNVSKTSSLTPPILVKNENFLHNYTKAELDKSIEMNQLKLMNVQFALTDTAGIPIPDVPGIVYPNGQNGLAFKFRPVYEVETMYVNDQEDQIVGYRGIPVSFTLEASKNGKISFDSPKVSYYLDYDKEDTENTACTGKVSKFNFHFLKDVEGKELTTCLQCEDGEESPPGCSVCTEYEFVDELVDQSLLPLLDREVQVPAVATIQVEEGAVPCDIAVGPGIISVISYLTPERRQIVHYGNKLPRLGGALISNPSALIRGNVYAQTTFTPSAQTESGQVLSTVNLDIVQDTVKENLSKAFLNKTLPGGAGKTCRLRSFEKTGSVYDCSDEDFVIFDVGDETVFYFKNSDVEISLDISWSGKKVLIVDSGNVYVDNNLYNSSFSDQRLSLIALRGYDKKYGDAGNVYIGPDVQNIQANIAISGSIFSYNGEKTQIDSSSGEPVWASNEERISTLNKQIFIQGSISSRNTIGGADLDSPRSGSLEKAKTYLLLGTGEILQNPSGEDRIRAQLYDLNYLRLFRMVIDSTPEGLPIDQACGKGLTPDDVMKISSGGSVKFNGKNCDGINPLSAYPPGDLIAPDDPSLYAQGVPSGEKNSPVYIFYTAPSKDSFVFSKPGALNIGR